MSKKVKRTISLIIAAIMLLSTMSVLAFADNAPAPHVCVAGKWEEDETQYAQPTCAKPGQKVTVLRCAICDKILDSKVDYLPKLTSHVAAEVPVIENIKNPTCKGGSYDEVIYCKICKKELERTTVKVKAIEKHVPAPAVIAQDPPYEAVPATCKSAGYHYSVVYCARCKEELSRTRVVDAPLAYHVSSYSVARVVNGISVPANKFVRGNTRTCADGDEVCLVCGKILTKGIPHVMDKGTYLTAADKPTATKWGKKTYTCLICNYTKVEDVPPKGPDKADVDVDGAVTTADARLILRFAVGLGAFDKVIVGDELIRVADVDESGDVEPADARLALRLAVGLPI